MSALAGEGEEPPPVALLSTLPTEPLAPEALGVAEGSPLLRLTRRSFNQDNGNEHLMDHLTVLYHPDRFQYRMDLELDKR